MKIGEIDLGNRPVILAPMEDVTDLAFRILCKENGADLVTTEFISAEGFIRDAGKSHQKISFDNKERPLAVQIFGNNADSIEKAVIKAEKYGPDIIDLNFGCPVKKIVNKGCGSALLKDIPLMLEITKRAVKATSLPVTVKTRIGWDSENIVIPELSLKLQDVGIKALTIHGRTRSQIYSGLANWEVIKQVKSNPNLIIPIIGNGDIVDAVSAKEKFDYSGVDGIMIGRAAIGNPWIFKQIKNYLNGIEDNSFPTMDERIEYCIRHLSKSLEFKKERTAIIEMRKHYTNYFKGIPFFKQHRLKLMELKNFDDVKSFFEELKLQFNNSDNCNFE